MQGISLPQVQEITLSKPAIFLFSAKNSAGLFCSRTSACLDFGFAMTSQER